MAAIFLSDTMVVVISTQFIGFASAKEIKSMLFWNSPFQYTTLFYIKPVYPTEISNQAPSPFAREINNEEKNIFYVEVMVKQTYPVGQASTKFTDQS